MAGKKKKAAKKKRRKSKKLSKATPATAEPAKKVKKQPALSSAGRVLKAPKQRMPTDNWAPNQSVRRRFTLELAEKYIDLEELGVERAVSDNHVEFLAKEMSQGNFLWNQASLDMVECAWDGKLRKLNGQHTCWARLSLPGEYQPLIKVNRWYVETPDEWRELYSRFDRNWSRTAQHVIQVNLFDTVEFAGVARSVLSKLSSGYRFWRMIDKDFEDNPEAIARELRTPPTPVLARHVLERVMVALSDTAVRAAFARAPVIAAMLETFSKNVAKSADFWDRAISGVGFTSRHDPAKRLRDWLMTVTLSDKGGGRIGVRRQVSKRDMWNNTITLYNDHKAGKERKGAVKLGSIKGMVRAKR